VAVAVEVAVVAAVAVDAAVDAAVVNTRSSQMVNGADLIVTVAGSSAGCRRHRHREKLPCHLDKESTRWQRQRSGTVERLAP
jgi:hypothetical protein